MDGEIVPWAEPQAFALDAETAQDLLGVFLRAAQRDAAKMNAETKAEIEAKLQEHRDGVTADLDRCEHCGGCPCGRQRWQQRSAALWPAAPPACHGPTYRRATAPPALPPAGWQCTAAVRAPVQGARAQ